MFSIISTCHQFLFLSRAESSPREQPIRQDLVEGSGHPGIEAEADVQVQNVKDEKGEMKEKSEKIEIKGLKTESTDSTAIFQELLKAFQV